MPKFFLAALLGLAVNTGALYVFAPPGSGSPWVCQVLVTALVFLLTFFLNKLWTFRDHRG